MWGDRRPRIANTIFKERNEDGVLTLLDFKTYHKAPAIKTMWHCERVDK